MANRMIEGFDYLATADLAKRFPTVAASTTVSANGRNGGSSLRMTNWSQGVDKAFDLQATWIIGFAFKTATLIQRQLLVFIDAGGALHASVQITAGGLIRVFRGDTGGTLLGTGTIAIVPNVWTYLEFKVTISDTVGVFVTRVNGVVDINLSNQDTRNAGTSASAYLIQIMQTSGSTITTDIDDMYINDGSGGVDDDFWGDGRVVEKSVDGAGNYAQFTPSTGSNWQNVDDATPDSDTTYNESSTLNQIDSMTTAALGVTGTIKGVEVLISARKTDAGVGEIAPHWRIANTDYAGTSKALSVDYTYVSQTYRVSPNTSSAWTVSELDGAELGYKKTL